MSNERPEYWDRHSDGPGFVLTVDAHRKVLRVVEEIVQGEVSVVVESTRNKQNIK